METAISLLGHPFVFKATVVKGKKRGRKLGFPTANLRLLDEIMTPAGGVYFCYVLLHPKAIYSALLNIGSNPSFENDGITRMLVPGG